MGEDRLKKGNPSGAGFMPKCFSEDTRGRSADPAMALHHLRILSISEWLVLVKNKMLLLVQRLLIAWAVCLQCPLDIRCTKPQESSPAMHFSSSVYWESTVSASSTKLFTHTHTTTECHTAYPRTAIFLKSRGITTTNYCWIKLHPALLPCFLWYLTAEAREECNSPCSMSWRIGDFLNKIPCIDI